MEQQLCNKALDIIRKEYPGKIVYNAFFYDDKWIFSITVQKEVTNMDMTVFHISVDSNGKAELYDFHKETYTHPEEISKAIEGSIIYIDAKEADLRLRSHTV